MSRSVVIAAIGKKHPGIPVYRPGMEVWGINDAYQHCPEIKRFYKFYNIHKDFPECVDSLPGRYKNWREEYNKSKALIVTAKDLGLEKQRILDIAKLRQENPDYVFCSSMSYMIFEAVKSGYKEIRLYRLSLNSDEYRTQGWGVIRNVEWAMEQGVKVYWPWLKFIRKHYLYDKSTTDWHYGEDVNMKYGEINDVPKLSVKDDDKSVKKDMTVKQLKDAIKAKGGKLPRGRANKDKLLQTLKELGNE